jgi:hypothetical protein
LSGFKRSYEIYGGGATGGDGEQREGEVRRMREAIEGFCCCVNDGAIGAESVVQ